MNVNEENIAKLDRRLAECRFEYAFIGGSVLSLLVSDASVDAIRVTKDVDLIMNIASRREYHNADGMLERLGFRHDTSDDAPICRWIYDGVVVDVLPMREDVLGWRSKWFEEALKSCETVPCGGRDVKIVSAPYFVALKLEAFEDRGQHDFISSTDFEDVICLFNGRPAIVDEVSRCGELRGFLASKFAEYLSSPELEDAIDGFMQTEDDPDKRKALVLAAFKRIADMANRG